MKKMILITQLFIAMALSSYSQTTSLEFVNSSTTCTVYVQIHADVAASCGAGQTSSVIQVLPTATVTFTDASTIPGLSLSAGDFFYYADVWTETPSIAVTCNARSSIDIGDCGNASWSLNNYTTNTTTCVGLCTVLSINWVPSALPYPQITF